MRTGLFVLLGLAGGIDTLCGQAFGAGNFALIGTTVQRAVAINIVVAMPILLAWTQLPAVLTWLQQDRQIIPMAGRFVLWSVPQLFCSIATTALEKYLTVQVSYAMYHCSTTLDM